jgi:hypothetical protein
MCMMADQNTVDFIGDVGKLW